MTAFKMKRYNIFLESYQIFATSFVIFFVWYSPKQVLHNATPQVKHIKLVCFLCLRAEQTLVFSKLQLSFFTWWNMNYLTNFESIL
jgi:hypothetical protein